jgi:hypothetical protein
MRNIILALCQSIYIIYVLNYFKTKYSIAHPFTFFENDFIYHPIGKSEVPISNICKLGHMLSWYLAGFLIVRAILLDNDFNKKYIKTVSLIVLVFGIILSMMNFNAVLYLTPHFIIEIYLLYSNYTL